jgi:hypothetical protein
MARITSSIGRSQQKPTEAQREDSETTRRAAAERSRPQIVGTATGIDALRIADRRSEAPGSLSQERSAGQAVDFCQLVTQAAPTLEVSARSRRLWKLG